MLPVERVLDIWCFLKDCSLAEADQIINLIFYDFLEPFYIFKLEGLNCDTSEGRIKFILEWVFLCSGFYSFFEDGFKLLFADFL